MRNKKQRGERKNSAGHPDQRLGDRELLGRPEFKTVEADGADPVFDLRMGTATAWGAWTCPGSLGSTSSFIGSRTARGGGPSAASTAAPQARTGRPRHRTYNASNSAAAGRGRKKGDEWRMTLRRWESNVGIVLVVRANGRHLSTQLVETLCSYCSGAF